APEAEPVRRPVEERDHLDVLRRADPPLPQALSQRAAFTVPEVLEDLLALRLRELAGGPRAGPLNGRLVEPGKREGALGPGGGRARGREKDESGEHSPAQELRARTHRRLLFGSRLARRDPYLALLKMGRYDLVVPGVFRGIPCFR